MAKKKKKDDAWRQFELLVARLEQILSPAGAVVTSPDRLKDRITGGKREVDASIRLTSGEIITVECRDRWTCKQGKKSKAKQDVLWIEQLVTKRADLGVSKTIGVSAGGFTKTAIAKAKHYGIELRQMSEVTDAEIAQQWAAVQATLLTVEFALWDARFVDADGTAFLMDQVLDDLPPETAAAFRLNGTATPFLRKKGLEPLVSAEDIFNAQVPHSEWLSREGEFGIAVKLESKADDYAIVTSHGDRILRLAILTYSVQRVETPAAVQTARQYSSIDGPLLDQLESVADLGDLVVQITATGQLLKRQRPV